jgi:hypothetical protein
MDGLVVRGSVFFSLKKLWSLSIVRRRKGKKQQGYNREGRDLDLFEGKWELIHYH